MERIDLNQLFRGLMEQCNVSGMEITTMRKLNEKPIDIKIKAYSIGKKKIKKKDVEQVFNESTMTEEFVSQKIKVTKDNVIEIYVELVNKPMYKD